MADPQAKGGARIVDVSNICPKCSYLDGQLYQACREHNVMESHDVNTTAAFRDSAIVECIGLVRGELFDPIRAKQAEEELTAIRAAILDAEYGLLSAIRMFQAINDHDPRKDLVRMIQKTSERLAVVRAALSAETSEPATKGASSGV